MSPSQHQLCHVIWSPATDGEDVRALLTEAERERYRQFHEAADRARFVTGRALTRATMSRFLGVPPDRLEFSRTCRRCGGPHGKPEVPGASVDFSLSHSGEHVLLAVAEHVEVGVDVERTSGQNSDRLAARVLSATERSRFAAVAPGRRDHAFRVYWTRKEALLKSVGQGVLSAMEEITVSDAEEQAELVAWGARTDVSRFELTDLRAPSGYVAALAVHGGRRIRREESRLSHPLDVEDFVFHRGAQGTTA
ncbi:4'-phosphopantetheinyl transferase family protein [Streptomyces hokutonensis]|uniref:4'-phosphopantetheinyl transferase family protein n=1 Tax=Streptomyces hokutonensis TaxID=1306990 RepID=UPI0033EBBD85